MTPRIGELSTEDLRNNRKLSSLIIFMKLNSCFHQNLRWVFIKHFVLISENNLNMPECLISQSTIIFEANFIDRKALLMQVVAEFNSCCRNPVDSESKFIGKLF